MELNRFNQLLESTMGNVKPLIMEEDETFDFSSTDKKLWSDYFTIKNDFKYVGNKNDSEYYSLKKDGFTLVVGVKHGIDQSNVGLSIFLSFPQGKTINYLQEVKGVQGAKINNSDFGQLSNLLQNAMDFGKAQVGYDNLPPLPRF